MGQCDFRLAAASAVGGPEDPPKPRNGVAKPDSPANPTKLSWKNFRLFISLPSIHDLN